MATRRIVETVDDFDQEPGAEPVDFGLDGTAYSIDLTSGHAAELRQVLAPFVAAGRRLKGQPRRSRTRR